jgi:hypothetical protein
MILSVFFRVIPWQMRFIGLSIPVNARRDPQTYTASKLTMGRPAKFG